MDRTDLLESLLNVNAKTISISDLTAEQKNILDQLIDMFIETVQYHVIVSVIVSRNWDKMKAVDDLMILSEIIGDTDNSLIKSNSKTTNEVKQERRGVDADAASDMIQPTSRSMSDTGNSNSIRPTDKTLPKPTTSKSYADVSSKVAPVPTSLILPTFNVNRSSEREIGFISYERMKRTRDSVERVRLFTKKGIKVMVLLRGCSGSGKSHLAKELVNASCPGKSYYNYIYSTDNYFSLINNGKYAFNADLLSNAHEWNRQNVLLAVQDNLTPIIIDNTNSQLWEMRDYVIMAFNGGYDIEIIEPSTVWSYDAKELARRNKHNTPKARIKEMLSRYESDITPAFLQKALGLQYAESNRPPQLGVTEPKNPYLLKTIRSLENGVPLHGSSASKVEKEKKPAPLKNIGNNNNCSSTTTSTGTNSNNVNTAGNNKRKADGKKLSGFRIEPKKDLDFILPLAGSANKNGGKKPRTVARATNNGGAGQTAETKESDRANVNDSSGQMSKISEVVKNFFKADVNGVDSFLNQSSADDDCVIIGQTDVYASAELDTVAAEKNIDGVLGESIGTPPVLDADRSYTFVSSSSSSSPLSMLGDDKHSSEFDQVEDLIRFSDDDQLPVTANVSGSLIDSPIQNRLMSNAVSYSEHEDATSTLTPVKDVNKRLDFRNVVVGREKNHFKEDNCNGKSLDYIRNVICNVNDKNLTVQHKSAPSNVDCCDNMNLAMYLAEDICSKQSVISDDDFKDNISRHSDRDINEFELLCQNDKNTEKVRRSNEDISAMYGERNIFTDQQSKLFKRNINSYMNVTSSPEQQFIDSGESSSNSLPTLSNRSPADEHSAIIRNDLKFLLPSSDEADVNKFINNRLDRVHDYEKNAYANKFRNKNSDEQQQQALSKINSAFGRDQKDESELSERRLSINAGEGYNVRKKNECLTEQQSKEAEKWNSPVTSSMSEIGSRAAINEKTSSVDKGDLDRQSERDFQELLKEVEKWSSLKTYSEDDLPLDVFESMRSDLQAAVGVERSSVSYSREDLLKIGGANKKEDNDDVGSVKMPANNIVFNNSPCLSGIEGLPVQFWRNPVKSANNVADGVNRTTESPKPIRPNNNNDWNRRKQNIDKDDNSSTISNNTDADGIEMASKNKNDFSDWNSVNSCAEASWKIENEKNSNVEIGAPKPIRRNADLNRKKQNNSRDDSNINNNNNNSNSNNNNNNNNNSIILLNDSVVNNKNEFSDWNSVSSCSEVDWKMDNEKSHKCHEPTNDNDNVVPDLDTLCTYLQKSNKTRDQAQNTSYKDVDEGTGFLIGRCREINEFHASPNIIRNNKKLTTNKSTMTDEENSCKRKPSLVHLLTVFPPETAEALYDLFDKCDGNIDWIVEMLCESGQTVLAEQLNLFISLQNKEADDKCTVKNADKGQNLICFPSTSKADLSPDEGAINEAASADETVEMNELVDCSKGDEAGASNGNQEEIDNTEEQVSEESKNVDLFLDPTIVNQLIDCYGNPTMIDIKGCATIISVPESLAQLLYAYLIENIITQREEAENILNQMAEQKENEETTDNAEKNDSVPQEVRTTDSLISVNEVDQISNSSNTESFSPDMCKLAMETLILTFPSLSADIIVDTFANLQYNYDRCKEVLNEYIADMPPESDQETNPEPKLLQTDNVHRQEDSFATKLSYRLLIDKFPNLSAEFIYDKFKKNNFNGELTSDILKTCKQPQSQQLVDDDDNLSDDQKSEYSTVFRTRSFQRNDIEVDVEKCREQASYFYSQWKYYTEKINEELRSNRPQVASYYRELANDQKEAYMKASNEAASLLLSTSQQADTKTFDLHSFKVKEALQGLDLFLDSHIRHLTDRGGLNSRTLLYIIIGRGKRSSDGKSHLKNPILMRLKKRKLKFVVPQYNPGMLIVTVRKNSLLSTDLKV